MALTRDDNDVDHSTNLKTLSELNDEVEQLHSTQNLRRATTVAETAVQLAQSTDASASEAGTALNNLAWLYHEDRRHDDAALLFTRAKETFESAFGPTDKGVGASLYGLAVVHHSRGQFDQAASLYPRALTILEAKLGDNAPEVGELLNSFAELKRTRADFDGTEVMYRRSIAIAVQHFGEEHESVARRLNHFSLLFRAQGRYADALPLAARAVSIFQRLNQNGSGFAASLHNMAMLQFVTGSEVEAEQTVRNCLMVYERVCPQDHPDIAHALDGLSLIVFRQGGYAEAEATEIRALALRERAGLGDTLEAAFNMTNLACTSHGFADVVAVGRFPWSRRSRRYFGRARPLPPVGQGGQARR